MHMYSCSDTDIIPYLALHSTTVPRNLKWMTENRFHPSTEIKELAWLYYIVCIDSFLKAFDFCFILGWKPLCSGFTQCVWICQLLW